MADRVHRVRRDRDRARERLGDRAALFVDGRYTLQAAAQVDPALFEIRHLIEEPPAQWLGAALGRDAVLGYDPWLHTPHEVERLRGGAERAGASLRRGGRQSGGPGLAGAAGRPARARGAARRALRRRERFR